jgi:putative ABC transport system ATP-binding protein
MPQIIVKDLYKKYGGGQAAEIIALDCVNFAIEQGEFVVILGPSGAGKTTLLNILGGMDYASSGDYEINDKSVTALDEKALCSFRRNSIGFVFQFYNLMPNLTALENVRLAESVVKNTNQSAAALEHVGLGGRSDNFPSQLSGGEQQRVAIARAIVKDPLLLLCDEPTGALDSKTGLAILKLLHDICRQENKTVIIVTHNEILKEVADRLIRIADGRIVENVVNKMPRDVAAIRW